MKILYLGIDLPALYEGQDVIHYPIIKIRPRPYSEVSMAFKEFPRFTHQIFTSKNAARLFFDYASRFGISMSQIKEKKTIAVGHATAAAINSLGGQVDVIAKHETSEGIVSELLQLNLQNSYFFWPHSALSRNVLTDFFQEKQLRCYPCIFYDTLPQWISPLPDLDAIDQIVFTSPSTIDAFIQIFGFLPKNQKICCIGPITQNYYNHLLN